MSYRELRVEAMRDIFENMGLSISAEDAAKISDDFSHHIDMEREMQSYQHVSTSSAKCDKCEILKREIKELEAQNKVYNNSVKSRRKAERVWIEGDTVMYE